MKRLLWLWVFAVLVGTSFPALPAGLIIVDDAHWWPGPVPPHPRPPRPPLPPMWRPHVFAPLELNLLKSNVKIQDQVAVTTIEQEFYNPNPNRLEGTFIFPVPKGAQLNRFTMEIDGKDVEAELLAANKARDIYEDIVRRAKDPALLEYAGQDTYKVRIFPIEPNSKKRVTIAYTQLLKSDGGLVHFCLPLSTEKFSAKPVKTVSVKVQVESKKPIKSIYSPSHAVEVRRDGPNRATAGFEGSDNAVPADFSLYFAPEKDDLGINLLTWRRSGEDGYFLLLLSPGIDTKEKQVVPRDVVFVLDTSGSMAGKKLEQAKKALLFCIENLNEGDRFEAIRFSTEVEPLFEKLVPATRPNREKATEFVKDLKPIGGTAIDDALGKALSLRGESGSDRPFVVIFLTDGRPTVGTTEEDAIVTRVRKAGENHARIFCFGIGTDVNTHLLDKITETSRAVSQYVLPEEDLEVKVSNFYAKIKDPVLANPKLRVTGEVRVTKLYPAPLPDLFKGEQLVLVGRYSGNGDAAIQVEGTVNDATRKFVYEGTFPERSDENDFIPRLWATRRVGYLLDEIRLHGENSELRDEATDLARRYGIVTPYTAYLILEDEARRNVPASARSLPELQSNAAAREQAADTYRRFRTESSGDLALGSARASTAMKDADRPSAALSGSSVAFGRAYGLPQAGAPVAGLPAARVSEGKVALQSADNNSRFISGKTFFRNGNVWIDATVQKQPDAKRQRIQFGSREYFDLAAKHPETLPWLAFSQSVQFVLNNTVHEIYE